MLQREIVSTDGAPAAIGPYSQAVKAGGLIFVSGQLPIRPADGELETGGIEAETELAFTSTGKILKAAGSGLEEVVKVTVYLTDLALFGRMNEVYARFFPVSPPARSTVGVAALPRGASIEIEVTALAGEPGE